MRQFESSKIVLLIAVIITLSLNSASAERMFEYRAEYLRLDSNRIYVWLDCPITVNSDFSLEIGQNLVSPYRTRVSTVLEKIAISSALPPNIIQLLQTKKDCAVSVYLESDLICDSLIIAMPSNLRELWLDTLYTANSNPSIRYLFRYFDDIKEVEIAAKLQQIDLLILPEIELPEAPILADSPYLLEWNLLSASIRDDLLATALNDCVRGLLADTADHTYSSLIYRDHLESVFPQNTDHSRELFFQSKKIKEKFDCYFPGYKMYPLLSEQFNLAMDFCSGRKFTFRDSQAHPLQLTFFAFENHNDSLKVCTQAIHKMADPIRTVLATKTSVLLDSCLLEFAPPDSCCEVLSRAIAESTRIVPLGRTQLAVRHFDHVRWLNRLSGSATLADFYTVKR